jgi:hypothetical protein
LIALSPNRARAIAGVAMNSANTHHQERRRDRDTPRDMDHGHCGRDVQMRQDSVKIFLRRDERPATGNLRVDSRLELAIASDG